MSTNEELYTKWTNEWFTPEQRLEDALNAIVAASHSWLITEATARIESPIHSKYRAMAQEALTILKSMKEQK